MVLILSLRGEKTQLFRGLRREYLSTIPCIQNGINKFLKGLLPTDLNLEMLSVLAKQPEFL